MARWLTGLALAARMLGASVVVDSSTTLLIDAGEPGPVQRAARDLAADMEKVFGRPVRVVHQRAEAAATTICVALAHNLPGAVAKPSGWEVLRIQAVRDPWPASKVRQAVVLTGSDARGAIFAVYQFAQEFLGVDPLYWWTDHQPARRRQVRIPDGFTATQGPPTFRYRGWFINDEDLLTGWKPGAADGTGIALEVWDRLFEAILRLKGNMVVPGTFLFPDEPQVRLAGERGLIITQHHLEVVGTNTWRWPADKPYSFAGAPELMTAAWTRAVKQYPAGQEVIWTLGYRGRHDRPFWSDDKQAAATDAGRARLIRAAIDRQLEIIRRERRQPYFLMNAWQEAVPFIRQGLLRLPDGVTLVWPDNGHGVVRDEGAIGKGQGVYYHTAMYNSRANQLTEMIPLERLRRELGRAVKAGATEYLLDNTSDTRPVVMTTRALMELAWDARPWLAEGGDAAYLRKWCREEFGERAVAALEQYYRAYFAAPARYGQAEHETAGDNFYHTVGRDLLVRLITGERAGVPRFFPDLTSLDRYAARVAEVTREAEPRWEQARALAEKARPLVAPARRDFFQAHVLTQLAIHLHSNRMLRLVAEAALENAPAAAAEKIRAATAETERVLEALQAAEYGQWAGFYKGDLFVNVRHTLALARAYESKLAGKPLPAGVPISVRPEDPYVTLKAYQRERWVEF
ncbi:MAG: glycosyl hydrolase 115 family protein [Acidobacteriota bacterium]